MLEGMAKESSYEVSWTCLGDGWKVCGAAACVRDTKTPILYIGCSSARLYCKGPRWRSIYIYIYVAYTYIVERSALSRYTLHFLHAAGLWADNILQLECWDQD